MGVDRCDGAIPERFRTAFVALHKKNGAIMQNRSKLLLSVAAALIAGTAAASAQGYEWNGPRAGWDRTAPVYEVAPPRAAYYPGGAGPYGPLNGTNHPTPSSTQGDVGPEGNNNGTLTGVYRGW
jgi:hypothetical protein